MKELELKEGLVDKYYYKDGQKYILQVHNIPKQKYKSISNFKRKTKEQYLSIHNSLFLKIKNAIPLRKDVPKDKFIEIESINPLGKNLGIDYEETNINKLVLNSINTKKYIILKITSKIYVNKTVDFVCEDNNMDIISVSINEVEEYYEFSSLDKLEKEIFKEGKYIIVIEPNYGIFESDSDIDRILIPSPNEIIILKDKEELNYFLDLNKCVSAENYKLLGNLMIKNYYYEKSIFYYNKGIDLVKDNENMNVILHSNLSEAYFKYGYFTKCIQNADFCLDKINELMAISNYQKDNILIQQKIKNIFRKIKALVSLRKYKEAYEILFNKSENYPYKDIIKYLLGLEQVQKLVDLIKNGNDNTLGKFDFKKMLEDEKIAFHLDTYGEYLNPKIEIQYSKEKGIKMCAKEKISVGELLIVEKALVFSRTIEDSQQEKEKENVLSKDNPKIAVEFELFNKLALKLKKVPLDYEIFYYLTDGKNLDKDLNERKKYLEEQDSGKISLDHTKVNQVIRLNKYINKREILYNNELCTGLWGFASFLNHDCLPNTHHFGIGDYYICHAIKGIAKGEEITTKYCNSKLSYEERQKKLFENWRFKCSCQLCKYQEARNDPEYNKYIKLISSSSNEKYSKEIMYFEDYLEKNKKLYSCYELANAYLLLEEFFFVNCIDFNNVFKYSKLVSKYANGRNYSFQLTNLNMYKNIII